MAETAKLKLSNDRKVSPLSRWEAGKKAWKPKVPNAFGLPAGKSCPGMTSVCEKVCYAKRTENVFPNAGRLVEHNWSLLQACGDDVEQMVELLGEAVDTFRKAAVKQQAELAFRLHWDGDLYSRPYAEAWAEVIRRNADVSFWCYTRTFGPGQPDVVSALAGLPNLRLLLSIDADNYEASKWVLKEHPWLHAAVLGEDSTEGQAAMVELRGRKAPLCPENMKRVPLVNDEGVGACISCKLCTTLGPSRGDVIFSITKK